MTIIRRGKSFYLRKRVPKRYAPVENRTIFHRSLYTDSEAIARDKAAMVWAHVIEGWEDRLACNDAEADARFEAARNVAKRHGFRCLPIDKVTALPRDKFLERVEAAGAVTGDKRAFEAASILGAVEQPKITVNAALDLFWGMSKDLIRHPEQRWSRNFGPVVKMDRLMRKTIHDDETKEAFA